MVDPVFVHHPINRHFQPVTALFTVRRERGAFPIGILANAVITILTRKGSGRARAPRGHICRPFRVRVSLADSGKLFNLAFRLAALIPTAKQISNPTSLAFTFFAWFPRWRICVHGATSEELTMARIAALSGAGSLAHAVTTRDRSVPDGANFCESICESTPQTPNEEWCAIQGSNL